MIWVFNEWSKKKYLDTFILQTWMVRALQRELITHLYIGLFRIVALYETSVFNSEALSIHGESYIFVSCQAPRPPIRSGSTWHILPP